MNKVLVFAVFVLSCSSALRAADTLDMVVIDAGFPGSQDRDAIRIEEAARAANVKQFDYLVVTHYDLDHVGNVPATVARIPAVTFVDHGPAAVHDPGTTATVKAYDEVVAKAKHLVVKAGDKIPFKGVDVLVVTSAGQAIKTPVAGGGGRIRSVKERPPRPSRGRMRTSRRTPSPWACCSPSASSAWWTWQT